MPEPTTVQIAPLAALAEAQALNEYYRNRNLLLANEVARLTAGTAAVEPEKKAK